MRAYELFLCKIWLCTHLGASLAQVGTELDFVPGGTWMHKMQYHRFRRTSTIVDDDVSYDDAAAAVIFFLLPSTQPHPPTKNCSGNIPKVVGNAVCCQRVRGPVLHRNSLPFPRCGFRPNWRSNTTAAVVTALPSQNKPPSTPTTFPGDIINAMLTGWAAIWRWGTVLYCKKRQLKQKTRIFFTPWT